MSGVTRIFSARKIITMNPAQPAASHVAVRDGRVLGVGALEELAGWGRHELDDSLAEFVLMPGLVEGHSHIQEGTMWRHPYLGFHDRRDRDGTLWPGLRSIDEVVARLVEAEAKLPDATTPLVGWGFDPIFFGGRRMVAADLDRVSPARSVAVIHASFHLMNVNTALIGRAGLAEATRIHGILRDADGRPTGELQEFAAKFMVYKVIGTDLLTAGESPEAVRDFGRMSRRAGVTTATDLHNDLTPLTVETYRAVTADPAFPIRLVPAFRGYGTGRDGVAWLRGLLGYNSDKLHFGPVKLMTDGSIQGFTGRLKWPGYYNGKPNGLWNVAPEELIGILMPYHRAGLQVHIHVNGDEASEVALDAIEQALVEAPRPDHRHTLQHCQMADAAQFRRMANLGICANLFCNHIYYWGDQHYAETMGPDRASRMDAAGTALRLGVPFAMHSDAPITPIGPLFTAWCAVNRLTASGRVLGPAERIPVAEALRAVTLGAAYTLKLDHEIGSIETGKRADFAVLDDDPLAVAPEKLKDVRVRGTVLGGAIFC